MPTKEELKAYRDWKDSQKTAEQKAADDIAAANSAKEAAEREKQALEIKVACLSKDVSPDAAEDVIALASRLTDEKADTRQIIEGLLWYYRCGKEPRNVPVTPRSSKRYYDYDEDSDYIYAAFMQQYGDDLITSHMHWWEFRAKFTSLTEATEFVKIMQYRGTDVSKIKCKEEKVRIKKLQERYALRSQKMQKFSSLEERNEAFKQKLQRRYEEVQRLAENYEKPS